MFSVAVLSKTKVEMTVISSADLGLAPLDKVVKMYLLSLARYASSWSVYRVHPEKSDQSE